VLSFLTLNTSVSIAAPLSIDQSMSSFALDGDIHILNDPDSELTVQNIISKYQRDELPTPIQTQKIEFEKGAAPHWLVIPIRNLTEHQEWFLNFGELSDGRTGIIKNLLIYEINQKAIIFNRLQNHSRNLHDLQNDNYIPIRLKPRSNAVLVIYITPNDYKSLSIVPTLHRTPTPSTTGYGYLHDFIATILIASILTALLGFIITRGVGYIPVILYYGVVAAWFYGFENKTIIDNFIMDTLIPLFPIIVSLIILLTTFFTVPTRYSNKTARIPLIFITIVNIALMIILSVFPNLFQFNSGHIPLIISTITLFICIVFLTRTQSDFIRPFALCLAGWIICLIFGQFISSMAITGSLDANFITSYADRLVLYPQFVFLLVGVILSIQMSHGHLLKKIRRESERARSVIHAQKSRDEMDHTRLLKVIEREREIMEELRARESERTEQMRAAKNMADEANQSKSAFLAVVSHEIRTPMTGLIGMLRMLENTQLSKDQKEYLDVIKDSSDTMLALLNDILDFSKIEKGVLDLENIEFDLKRVLMAVNTLMKTHADQKNIALNLLIDPEMPNTLFGDPTRLRQVFLNLVGNALKFTNDGHVTVKADLNAIDEKQCIINFAIEDTGIGISQEAQENLFTPFAQADSSITRKYGGTGLGLAICKTLVEAMGGNITLKSTEGIGTTFYFTLAFALKSDVQIKKGPSNSPSLESAITPMNILIVDDNEVNIKVITEFLKEDNHTVNSAMSGEECLETLKQNSDYHVILVDIEMPGMSGVELAETILKNRDMPPIPLLAMTGNIGLSDVELYQEKGFKGLVGKPFDPAKIRNLLANVQNAPQQAHFDKGSISQLSSDDTKSDQKKDQKQKGKAMKKPSIGKALDDIMLTNLKNGLGTQKTRDLLDETFEKADSIIQQMQEAVNDNDKESIYKRAHELKGMCSNFGLKAISEKALEIETAAKIQDYDIDDFNPHVEDLKTLLERSKIAVDKFFGN